MSYGHIKLYRSLLDSKVFANEKSLKIWIWLLLKATFEKKFVSIVIGKGKHTVELMPGELIFGRFQAEEALCIDGSTIYKKLKEFEQEEMIMITSNSHYSIITICNWDIYQSIINEEVATNELPSNSQVATNELPSNTNKKDKKVNKEKNIIYSTLVEFWLKEFHIGFIFNGTAGKALKQIIIKLETILKNENSYDGDDSVINLFKFICFNLPDWFKDKDLSVINSKLNEIILQIKNKNNGNTNYQKWSKISQYRPD